MAAAPFGIQGTGGVAFGPRTGAGARMGGSILEIDPLRPPHAPSDDPRIIRGYPRRGRPMHPTGETGNAAANHL